MNNKNKIIIVLVILLLMSVVFIVFTQKNNKIDNTVESDPFSLFLKQNGCDYNNPQILDHASYSECIRNLVEKMKKEQNQNFLEYLSLLNEYPKDDVHILNSPFYIEDAIASIKNWKSLTNNYIESKCIAESETIGSASGGDDIRNICEIEILKDNNDFLQLRISEFKEYSINLNNLIKSGVDLSR